jgi:hypothetical protein
MKKAKREALTKAGWTVGSADDLLGLSASESAQVDAALAVGAFGDLRIPKGWTLESLERQPDYALLSTSSSPRYMATIDFKRRGIRSGYSTTGRYVGEDWNKPRKKYTGRGWKQALMDDAIAHLSEVLR